MENLPKSDEWMREIDKIFKTVIFYEEHKVGLATYLFVDEVDHWLNSVKPNREEEQANSFTSEKLKEKMNQ